MNAYDYLVPPLQSLVDRMAISVAGDDWDLHRAYLTSVYSALERNGPPLDAQGDLAFIIAALVERLGEPDIDSALQAGIYAASAKQEHRDASKAWFDRHPDELAEILRAMAHGTTLH